jgi:hypothetical protein
MNFLRNRMLATSALVFDAPTDQGIAEGNTTEQTFDGEALAEVARGLAIKVSDVTEAAVETAAKGKEDWQGGPISVLAGLQRDFTNEELDAFAEPNSDTGNNPDRYKMQVTDSSGKSAMRPTSFYQQFADGTKHGKAIIEELALLRRANNVEAIKTDIPETIMNMTVSERDDRIKFLDNRRTTVRNAYRKAMSLYFQLNAVGELTVLVDEEGKVNSDPAKNTRFKQGTVGVDFIYVTNDAGEDTDQVVNSPNPIIIWEYPGYDAKGNQRPIKNSQKVSIGSFLKFDAKKAAENGGTYKALLKTVERKPRTPEGAKPTETPAIKTVDTFVGRLVETYRFMNEMQQATDPKDLGKLYQIIKADMNAKDRGELVVTIVEMRNYLDDVCDELQLTAKYTELQKKRPELTSKKAA